MGISITKNRIMSKDEVSKFDINNWETWPKNVCDIYLEDDAVQSEKQVIEKYSSFTHTMNKMVFSQDEFEKDYNLEGLEFSGFDFEGEESFLIYKNVKNRKYEKFLLKENHHIEKAVKCLFLVETEYVGSKMFKKGFHEEFLEEQGNYLVTCETLDGFKSWVDDENKEYIDSIKLEDNEILYISY